MVNTKNFIILKFCAKIKLIREKLSSFFLSLNVFCLNSALNAQQLLDKYCHTEPKHPIDERFCNLLREQTFIQQLFDKCCHTEPKHPIDERFCNLLRELPHLGLSKNTVKKGWDEVPSIEFFLPSMNEDLMPFNSILFSNSYTILPSLIFLLCFLIFLIGLAGLVVVNNNLLIILMSIEIMFFGLGLFTIFFSLFVANASGFIIALVMITTSAAETVIGLSLLVRYCVLLDNITVSKNIVNPYLS